MSKYFDIWPVSPTGYFIPNIIEWDISNEYHRKAKEFINTNFLPSESIKHIYLRGSSILKLSRFKPLDIDLIIVVKNPKYKNLISSFVKKHPLSMMDISIINYSSFTKKQNSLRFVSEVRAVKLYTNSAEPLPQYCYKANHETALFLFNESLQTINYRINRKQINFKLIEWYIRKFIRLLGIESLARKGLYSRDLHDCITLAENFNTSLSNQAKEVLLLNENMDIRSSLRKVLEFFNNIIESSCFFKLLHKNENSYDY